MYSIPCGIYNRSYIQELAIVRTKARWILLIVIGVSVVAMPYYVRENTLTLINTMLIWIIATIGLNLLTGYCGEISIGHAAFMGIGAYTSAILSRTLSFPFWFALPCATLITGVIGLLFALPATRMKGFYLAIVTLAAQVITSWVFANWKAVTGGHEGLGVPSPRIGQFVFDTETRWFYLSVFVVFVMGMVAKNIMRSKVGRAFVAVRDNDLAAEVMGINLFKYKSIGFFTGCAYAGAAGSMWAHYSSHITHQHFTLHESIWFMGMIIVGGMGKTMGPFFGVIFIFLLKRIVTYLAPFLTNIFPSISLQATSSLSLIFFGVVIAFFLIVEPRGIAHWWDKFKNY